MVIAPIQTGVVRMRSSSADGSGTVKSIEPASAGGIASTTWSATICSRDVVTITGPSDPSRSIAVTGVASRTTSGGRPAASAVASEAAPPAIRKDATSIGLPRSACVPAGSW